MLKLVTYPLVIPDEAEIRRKSVLSSRSDLVAALNTAKECRATMLKQLNGLVATLEDVLRKRTPVKRPKERRRGR